MTAIIIIIGNASQFASHAWALSQFIKAAPLTQNLARYKQLDVDYFVHPPTVLFVWSVDGSEATVCWNVSLEIAE
jgi:hypothetical protein